MGKLRRFFVTNAPVFITSVTWQRSPYLRAENHKQTLLSVMREVKTLIPYRMVGYVILDDHFHWIIFPDYPEDFPRIMQAVKLHVARRLKMSPCWQRRYWDHIIRDVDDLHKHLDYIHYNPVRHGYVNEAGDYAWSSFNEYVKRGRYTESWGVGGEPKGLADLVPE